MKSFAVATCLLFTASLLPAQTTSATTTATSATTDKVADVKTDAKTVNPAPAATIKPGAASPKTVKKDDKKKEELPKIPGTVITRDNGNLMGLEVVDGNFKLSFYDKKHKPMGVDVTRVTARWPNTRSSVKAWNRTVLNSAGTYLIGQNPVQPPYTWNVYLTLLVGEGEDAKAVENYTVAFKG